MDLSPDLHLLGISFRTASEEVREGLAFSPAQTAELLARATRELPGVEAVVLSTCNRTEFYLAGPGGAELVAGWHRLLRTTRPGAPALDDACARYELHGADAFRHLLRVACGLDSLLLGDSQVLGQVRQALAQAQDAGTLGGVLSPAFATALGLGRQARARTDIGKGAPGVGPAVATALTTRMVPTDAPVLVLGSGQAARAVTRSLAKAGYRELTPCARSAEPAAQVAREVGGATTPWSALADAVTAASVVVAATAAPTPVLTQVSGAVRLVVDAGFPRQVAEQVDAELVSLLALTAAADAAAEARQAAVPEVESLVAAQVAKWQLDRERAPVEQAITDLHVAAAAAAKEASALLAQHSTLPAEQLEAVIGQQVRRMLHPHVQALRAMPVPQP